MPKKYQNTKKEIIGEALRCAIQDRMSLLWSLRSGNMTEDDKDYCHEIEGFISDFQAMQSNMGFEVTSL